MLSQPDFCVGGQTPLLMAQKKARLKRLLAARVLKNELLKDLLGTKGCVSPRRR
jgi:hypothetical protein